MPTILLKKSDTPGSVPGTANLTNLAGGVEVAVNTADKRVYSMTSASAVIELGTNPSSLTCSDVSATVLRSASATITNLIATSASITTLTNNPTFSAGTANGVLFLNGSKVATSGSALVFDGANLLIGQTTNAQNYRLVIKGSAGSADDLAFNSDATRSEIQSFNSKPLELNRQGNNVTIGSAGSGNLGIGTASPGQKLEVAGNILVNTSGNPYAEIKTSGSGNNPYLKLTADTNSWTFQGTFSNANDDLLVLYNATTLLDLDKNGNLGLGVTPSAWVSTSGYRALQVGNVGLLGRGGTDNSEMYFYTNAYNEAGTEKYISSSFATKFASSSGAFQWHTAPSGTAGNAITFTQAMTLDASGRLLVGNTTNNAGEALQVDANGVGSSIYTAIFRNTSTGTNVYNAVQFNQGASGSATGYIGTGGSAVANNAFANNFVVGTQSNSALVFNTNDTERARITSGGDFVVGKTSASIGTAGGYVTRFGEAVFTVAANPVLYVNRLTDDGDLVRFYQADTQEGSISVSGNTVSYNAFAGSHWSQLQDGSKPDILRGTVMESINELCVWPGEQNERLPKSKISDTAGSKKVYGVFMAWDNDWTETNDMYVTAVGAFICRVNGSVTVQEGDLLESNGDGTARVQADDIIRSSTIGKVTSTVKTHQYDDGSYCVPTVLYCG